VRELQLRRDGLRDRDVQQLVAVRHHVADGRAPDDAGQRAPVPQRLHADDDDGLLPQEPDLPRVAVLRAPASVPDVHHRLGTVQRWLHRGQPLRADITEQYPASL